jgi:hypothetical protein
VDRPATLFAASIEMRVSTRWLVLLASPLHTRSVKGESMSRIWFLVAAVTLAACVDEPIEAPLADPEVSVEESASTSDADRCFNTATWVPATPPVATCACDPYNPCASTLLSEQCSPYTPTGVPIVETYWTRITCPELTFGWQQVTTTTTTLSAFCTIAYRCNGSTLPCGGSGTKFIKRKKVVYGRPICPGGG